MAGIRICCCTVWHLIGAIAAMLEMSGRMCMKEDNCSVLGAIVRGETDLFGVTNRMLKELSYGWHPGRRA